MQVPGNFDAPSHQAVRELARRDQWSEPLRDFPFREGQVDNPSGYAALLTDAGCTVDAWETTYIHELSGEHPVLEWITGTALRPVKSRLTDEQWQQFRQELIPLLDDGVPGAARRQDVLPVPPDIRGGSGWLTAHVEQRR